MPSTPADVTDDVSCEILLFRTVVFTVSKTTAILTDLVFVVTQRAIQGCEFPKLVSLMVILTFGRGCSLRN